MREKDFQKEQSERHLTGPARVAALAGLFAAGAVLLFCVPDEGLEPGAAAAVLLGTKLAAWACLRGMARLYGRWKRKDRWVRRLGGL